MKALGYLLLLGTRCTSGINFTLRSWLLQRGSFPPGVLVFLENKGKPWHFSLCTGGRQIYSAVDTKGSFVTFLLEDAFPDLTLPLGAPIGLLVTQKLEGNENNHSTS